MNILLIGKKINKYEGLWRNNIEMKPDDYDDMQIPFPFPIARQFPLKDSKKDILFQENINKIEIFEELLEKNNKYKKEKSKNCLICGKKNISNKMYNLYNVHWENGLIHYLKVHNIKLTDDFIAFLNNVYINKNDKFVYNKSLVRDKMFRLNSLVFKRNTKKYIKINRNQMMILDALMESGGYEKKYEGSRKDNDHNILYTEHAGLLDFSPTQLERIMISTSTPRADHGDPTILLPQNIPDAYDYEYFFHTHPPTPTPGYRAKEGILYEFPSVSDIFHFIEHYNEGDTQGSIIITPEGIYIIKAYQINPDEKIIYSDEEYIFNEMEKKSNEIQEIALKKYGSKFTVDYFLSVIAQDISFIRLYNEFLRQYQINIFYRPRINKNKRWVLPSIYLQVYPIEEINTKRIKKNK